MDSNESVARWKQFNDFCPFIDSTFREWLWSNGYFAAPASTKYHGNYEGGLFDHSFAVAKSLVELTERNELNWQDKRSPIIIGLFHDICKIDQYKQQTETLDSMVGTQEFPIPGKYEYRDDMLLKGHGDKSVMLLASHFQLTEEEVMCIRYHMGAFTPESEWKDYTRAVHKYPNVLWTHHADMIASHVMGV